MNNKYMGYVDYEPTDNEWDELYAHHTITSQKFLENEYVNILKDGKKIDTFCYQNEALRPVLVNTIHPRNYDLVKPRNDEQNLTIDMLLDRTSKVKIVQGVYGSGKDYLMLSAALKFIQDGVFDKLIFTRPNITVANLPDIGALPGTADEKLQWTLGPLQDKFGESPDEMSMVFGRNAIETIPMLYIRGRDFKNSLIYVTEGQNMTTEIAKLVLGRIGEGSELWINADTHQTDKKVFQRDNGVTKMVDVLRGNPLFGYVYMPKTERSAVANLANLLDEAEDEE